MIYNCVHQIIDFFFLFLGYYGIDVLTINEDTDYIKRWNSTNNDTNNGTDENKIMN